jgi:putative solute:sodium symporter small subunit
MLPIDRAFSSGWRVIASRIAERISTETPPRKRRRFQSLWEVAVANDDAKQRHWEKTRNLTFLILILWAIFALIIPWFADALNSVNFLGFPLGYYMCVQGSLIAFVLMIWFQNWRQEAIDDEFGVSE